MFGKLSQLKEKQRERIQTMIGIGASGIVAQSVVSYIVEKAAEVHVEAELSKPKKVEVKYSVIESFDVQNNEQILRQRKDELIKTINLLTRVNHYLLVQYLGVFIQHKQSNHQSKTSAENKIEMNIEKMQFRENQYAIKILGEPNLQVFHMIKYQGQPKTKEQFIARLIICRQIIEAVAYLHDHQLSFFPHNAEEIILTKGTHAKIASHKFKHWRQTKETEIQEIKSKQASKIKKSSMIGRSTKYVSPELVLKSTTIRDIRYNDIWKIGILVFTLLTGQDFSKEVLGLEDIPQDRVKDYKIISDQKQTKLKKYCSQSIIIEMLKTLKIIPSERKPLKLLLKEVNAIHTQVCESFNEITYQQSKEKYLAEQKQIILKFAVQLKANEELLSPEMKKKITEYFKNTQNRILNNFKVILRGSQSKFSSKCFYQAVFERKHILIIFQDKHQKKKIVSYSEESFDLHKCNGVFGGFIKDAKKLSFIYSPQQNQFCKLKNADKAIGVSHIQGPVIGDGDIAISDGGLYNICRFPSSYEATNKVKKLLKADKFELQQYDVYQCLF